MSASSLTQPDLTVYPYLGFNHTAPRYQVLCGKCHSKTCTVVLSLVCLLVSCFVIICGSMRVQSEAWIIVSWENGTNHTLELDIALSWICGTALALEGLQLIAIAFIFIGLCHEKHLFLLPYLSSQMLCLLGISAAFITLIYALASETQDLEYKLIGSLLFYNNIGHYWTNTMEDLTPWLLGVMSFVAFVLLVAQAWAFVVVVTCYRYLRDKRDWTRWLQFSVRRGDIGGTHVIRAYDQERGPLIDDRSESD